MASEAPRVTVERVDYAGAMRFTRLFSCFRMAMHPSRLLLALLLIVLLYISGRLLDTVWGRVVLPGEFERYVSMPAAAFDGWAAFDGGLTAVERREGIFITALHLQIRYFEKLVQAAVELKPGFDQLAPGAAADTGTVLGSLRYLAYIPLWLWHAHFWFFVAYLTLALLLWSLLAGAITRQTVVESSAERIVPATEAIGYTFGRWGWYIMAPLIAPAVVLGVALVLAAVGLAFYVPGLNIVAAVAFVLALGLGFVMALLLIGWLAGVNLMYPALGAEGTDAFDAMSRAYSYVFARPWRFIAYSVVALVYGAATYMLVGVFVYLTIALTQWAAGAWVSGFEQVFPTPKFGQLSYALDDDPRWASLRWDQKATGTVILVWVYLVIGVLGAYAISYYLSAYSVIYLLLRRYTDGTDVAEVFEPAPPASPVAAEKVEPAAAPAAAPAEPGAGGPAGGA